MTRIKIKDLPADLRIQEDEMKKILAGSKSGSVQWGGLEASLQGTGGVALLEFEKDAIQTAASNISGVGTNQLSVKKIVERKNATS